MKKCMAFICILGIVGSCKGMEEKNEKKLDEKKSLSFNIISTSPTEKKRSKNFLSFNTLKNNIKRLSKDKIQINRLSNDKLELHEKRSSTEKLLTPIKRKKSFYKDFKDYTIKGNENIEHIIIKKSPKNDLCSYVLRYDKNTREKFVVKKDSFTDKLVEISSENAVYQELEKQLIYFLDDKSPRIEEEVTINEIILTIKNLDLEEKKGNINKDFNNEININEN